MIIAVGLLAGCANGFNVPDGSPAYKDGYLAGCQQGYYDGGWQVATPYTHDRQKTDAEFGRGWEEGHARCYAQQLATPRITPAGAGVP